MLKEYLRVSDKQRSDRTGERHPCRADLYGHEPKQRPAAF